MSKYNLHITYVPDHKAQMVLARIIVGSDNMISIQQAMEMASKPPLLLFHNLERKELKQHTEHLTSLGVKFNLSEVQEVLDVPDESFGGHQTEREFGLQSSANDLLDAVIDEDYAQSAHQQAEQKPPPKPAKRPTQLRQPDKSASKAFAPPVHAAGHEYHKNEQHGYRIGSLDAAAMKDAEVSSRKKSFALTSVIVVVLLLIGLAVLHLPQGNKFTVERAPGLIKAKSEKNKAPPKTKSGGNSVHNAAVGGASVSDSAGTAAQPDGEPRVQATAQQKQQSNALVDSARADGGDLKRSVAFYKMAISFNRQNLAAWQGLLQAYRELHMDGEAHETERQMREIFGTEALSVVNIVKSYGEIIDVYVREDNAHSVEYKTAKTSKVDILRDVFSMTRAVRAACACQNISIHASTGIGKGVTAHSTQSTSIHTLSEFMRQAEIVWLE